MKKIRSRTRDLDDEDFGEGTKAADIPPWEEGAAKVKDDTVQAGVSEIGTIDPETGQPVKRRAMAVDVRCRHCIFFERSAVFEDKCIKLHVQPTALPCHKFVTDPRMVNFDRTEIVSLTSLMQQLRSSELAVLAAIINQEKKTRNNGFWFGQTVYVRAIGQDDYLSNYLRAHVISSTGGMVWVQGEQGWYGSFSLLSVLDYDQFEAKTTVLRRKGRLIDPKMERSQRPPIASLRDVSYQPPVAGSADVGASKRTSKRKERERDREKYTPRVTTHEAGGTQFRTQSIKD